VRRTIQTLFLLVGFSLLEDCVADSWKNLKSGDQAAQEFLNKVDQKKKEAGIHPFYKGISQEATLTDAELKGKSQTLACKDPVGQMLQQSADSRPQFKIDPVHDPLIKGSKKIIETPLEELGGKGTQIKKVVQAHKDEIVLCEEAGDDSLESCTSDLKVKVIKTKIKKEWQGTVHYWMVQKAIKHGHYLACGPLRHGVFRARQYAGDITGAFKACLQELGNEENRGSVQLPHLNFLTNQILEVRVEQMPQLKGKRGFNKPRYYSNCSGDIHNSMDNDKSHYNCTPRIKIVYEENSYQILPDEWISNCTRLEERSDQGLCSYASKVCTQGKQTRVIEGIPVTKDCWQETYTYSCSYPAKNDCSPLRARGCVQQTSNCKQMVGKTCVVYTQSFQCKSTANSTFTEMITGGKTSTLKVPFCIDGNCRDQSWEGNDEMMSSMAQLSLLKEMQGQVKNGTFFKGSDDRCTKQPLSFKDCCGSGKGWGNDLGLSSCKAEEKSLSKKRKAGLCHYVGTYCAKKVLGQCIKKKSSYCCFGSKLLKAFHVQGRPQIRMEWGDAENPLCRGFTVEEIQRIDFSKLDLREVFEDLMKNYRPSKLQGMEKRIGERLEAIKKGMTPNSKQQSHQRSEG